MPTHFLEGDRKSINVGGAEIELVAAPGETNDELFVWYPAGKVLFAGDNFYRSFPNLYAIRGTPNRSTRLWAESLGKKTGDGRHVGPTWMRPAWSAVPPIRFPEPTRSSKF